MKCDTCGFQKRGTKRGKLRKILDMHQKLCEAAMDTVVEQQGDYLENSVLESLREAEVAVNNFLKSNHSLKKRLGKHQSLRKADITAGNFL
jgi:hypothetical protein